MNWQQTIAVPTQVQGVGYWSGLDVNVEFHPAEPNTGIVFVRRDLKGSPRIPALVDFRTDTPRRSDLECDGVKVEMIEHVMAALSGLGIDNCEIHVTQSEMPGCDGASRMFVNALQTSRIVQQSVTRRPHMVLAPLRVGDERCWIEVKPAYDGRTTLTYDLDYGAGSPIHRQCMSIELTPENFVREIAPARTFLLKSEADAILAMGIGTKTSPKDLLVFDENGPIGNKLRFENECVRHKLLDMIGDLALAGCRLTGHFRAYRTGHHHNAMLVKQILDQAAIHSRRRMLRCA